MHRIEQEFVKIKELNPLSSSVILFGRAMRKTRNIKVERSIVEQLFNKLVDKEDYDKRDKPGLIDWLLK
jgi:hypothetical protein